MSGVGYTVIPVLEFLWGKPWNDMAKNYLRALRPSDVRETFGEIKNDARPWRVTVILERVITPAGIELPTPIVKRIEQEVEVNLEGATCGFDLKLHDRDRPRATA